MKLKSRPTMRSKKHYVIFRLHYGDPEFRPDFMNVRGAIWNSLESWLGEAEAAKANIRFIMNLWDPKTQTGFLSCSPKYVDKINVAMALVHQIGDQRVIVQVLRVSGTIKSGKEKAKL